MNIPPEKKENLLDALVNLLRQGLIRELGLYSFEDAELRRIAREIMWVVEHNV